MTWRLAVAVWLSFGGAATANAQTIYSEERFRAGIDACIQTSSMDEFDTIEAVLGRVQAACPMQGIVRMPLPRQEGLGHLVRYDPELQAFVWTVVPNPSFTTMAGGGASPYSRRYNPMQWDQLPRPVKQQLTTVGNTWFWLLPVQVRDVQTSAYEGSNAMGARTSVSRLRTH